MTKKLDQTVIEQIRLLDSQGNSSLYIAQRLGISQSTAHYYRNGQWSSPYHYRKQCLQRDGLTPYSYLQELARRKGTTVPQQREARAKAKGFPSSYRQFEHTLHQQGYHSVVHYQEEWARSKGWKSLNAYKKAKTEARRHQPVNQAISSLLLNRLKAVGKNQRWLAHQLGVNKATIYHWIHGYNLPRQDYWQRLCTLLQITPSTLEDIVKEAS